MITTEIRIFMKRGEYKRGNPKAPGGWKNDIYKKHYQKIVEEPPNEEFDNTRTWNHKIDFLKNKKDRVKKMKDIIAS